RRIYAAEHWSQELRGHWPARPARKRLLSVSCSSDRSFAPRFLPTIGRPHAVALHFTHCDQLVTGLAPVRVRPCWAHQKSPLSLRQGKGVGRSHLRRCNFKGAPAPPAAYWPLAGAFENSRVTSFNCTFCSRLPPFALLVVIETCSCFCSVNLAGTVAVAGCEAPFSTSVTCTLGEVPS